MLASVVSSSVVPSSRRAEEGRAPREQRASRPRASPTAASIAPSRRARGSPQMFRVEPRRHRLGTATRLEPVDGDRFLVPQFVMIADDDEIARLPSFPRRLRRSGLRRGQASAGRTGPGRASRNTRPASTAYAHRVSIKPVERGHHAQRTLGIWLHTPASRSESSAAGMAGTITDLDGEGATAFASPAAGSLLPSGDKGLPPLASQPCPDAAIGHVMDARVQTERLMASYRGTPRITATSRPFATRRRTPKAWCGRFRRAGRAGVRDHLRGREFMTITRARLFALKAGVPNLRVLGTARTPDEPRGAHGRPRGQVQRDPHARQRWTERSGGLARPAGRLTRPMRQAIWRWCRAAAKSGPTAAGRSSARSSPTKSAARY